MQYYVHNADGKEAGPFEEGILISMAHDRAIGPDTLVRSGLSGQWGKATETKCLCKVFDEFVSSASFGNSSRGAGPRELLDYTEILKYRYLPDPSPVPLRVASSLIDLLCILVFSFFSCLIIALCFDGSVGGVIMNLYILVSILVLILYYSVSYGVFAQTAGMYFFGILIVCRGVESSPVYLLRAYGYTILTILTGVLSLPLIYIFGRSISDYIFRVNIVRISSRPSC